MAYRKVNDTSLASVADAIRAKGGTSDALVFPDGFVSAISAIQTGGGGAGSGSGNVATGSFTNSAPYSLVALNIMTLDEWVTNYGDFPTTLYAAYFDENPGEITSGAFPLYCASCVVDGNAKKCYATVYNSDKISYSAITNAIAQANKSSKTIQIISPGSIYSFQVGRTYRWVIIW